MIDNTADLNDYMLGCDPSEPNIYAMNESKDMLVGKRDPFAGYEPFGNEWRAYMMKLKKEVAVTMASNLGKQNARLRAERDEALGALTEVVYQADEGMPMTDVSPCIVRASKLLSKHSKEGQEVTG